MKIERATLVIEPGDPSDVIEAVSGWLARHGIKISPFWMSLGMSVRRDVDGRKIGVLCECEDCLMIGAVVWFQLEAAPLPWPKIVLEMTS